MPTNPDHQHEFEELMDLTRQYGLSTPFNARSEPNQGFAIATMNAAPLFVDEIIAQAEPLFQAGNRTGLAAALIEAHSWLYHVENLAKQFSVIDDHQEAPHQQALHNAFQRLTDASIRYRETATQGPPHNFSLMLLWRACIAPSAFSAMLNHHIDVLRQSDDINQARNHNHAAHGVALTITKQMKTLDTIASAQTTGPRPSQRQITRCLNSARDALRSYHEAKPDIDRTRPIRQSAAISATREAAPYVEEITQQMIDDGHDYAIDLNADEPEMSIIAYRSAPFIKVKFIIEHYGPDVDADTAQQHAESFIELNDHVKEEHGPEAATEHMRIASMVCMNAIAGLHQLNRNDFDGFIETLRFLNDDPIAIRHAASDAVLHGTSGIDILFEYATPIQDLTTTPEQAELVISAARDAGFSNGKLRAICGALRVNPASMGIPSPSTKAADLILALQICPVDLHPHQVVTIARHVGADPDDPQIIQWIDKFCINDDDLEYHDG